MSKSSRNKRRAPLVVKDLNADEFRQAWAALASEVQSLGGIVRAVRQGGEIVRGHALAEVAAKQEQTLSAKLRTMNGTEGVISRVLGWQTAAKEGFSADQAIGQTIQGSPKKTVGFLVTLRS